MRKWFYPLSTSFVIAFGLGSAYADPTNPATGNRDWGQTTKQMTRVDDGKPGIGEHASSPPGFRDADGKPRASEIGGQEGGRRGVGNVSKEDFDDPNLEGNPLSGGAQGEHARVVGEQMGVSPDPRPGQP